MKNKTSDSLEFGFAEKLLDIAMSRGVDEAEVYARSSKTTSIEVKDQKIDTIESSNTTGYCIRVIKNKRLGFSYSTHFDDINKVAEQAIEAAGYSEPDNYLCLPYVSGQSEVITFDSDIASLDKEEAVSYALTLERFALDEDYRVHKVRSPSATFTVTNTVLINSNGVNTSYSSTGCSGHLSAIAEDGNESQMGWDYEGNRFLKEVSFERVGRNAARRAVQLLGAKRTNSFKGSILLDNSIVCEFLGILSSALSAEAVQKKRSMLAGRLGTCVISQRLNIVDSGLLYGRLGSKPVDDEGMPTKNKILIEKGVLNSFIYNTYTAGKDLTQSTGNAARNGFRGLPSVGITNLYIESASDDNTASYDSLVKMTDRGLYVIETMGMHTANPISGEFSVGVSGLLIEKGEIKNPVKEAVISGNILDLFNRIVMVGDDLRFYGNIGAPSLLIDGIDISG